MYATWGCHLDVTQGALAGTLGDRVKEATSQVISVGALPVGFQRILPLVCSKHLPTGRHNCQGSTVSGFSLGAFPSDGPCCMV